MLRVEVKSIKRCITVKNRSLRATIVIPSLAILVVGIVILVAVVATLSSRTAKELTDDLMDARVQQYTNEFRVFSEDVYAALETTTPIITNYIDPAWSADVADPRGDVINILSKVLLSNDNLIGAWTVWEPNAFDGNDAAFANTPHHDDTGRFIPYIYRDGSSYGVEALVGYDDPAEGEYYLGARNSGKPYATDPYAYSVGGKELLIFSIAIPVFQNGTVMGVVGVDIDLNDITEVMNSGSILSDGYLFTLSPGGNITTHPNTDLLMSRYDKTWLSSYSGEVESKLKSGGNFHLNAYSDVTDTSMSFLGQAITIGETGRYWLICGVVPEKTVSASSTSLLWMIIAIGAALIIVVGVTIFIVIRRSLIKLPSLTAAAEAISLGDVATTGFDTGTAPTKNEITLLERAFVKMTAGISDQADVMSRIADGDYSITVNDRSDKDIMNRAIRQMLDNTNQTLHQINTSTTQVSTGSKQVADGAQSLAQGSTEQAASIEELSSSISAIATMTKENAAIAERTSKLSETIKDNAEKGSRQMDDMIAAVDDINEASKNISKIIKTIDDIAFQTNILALNAAVEAARAGQHGKGFAVVAEEVRNLASKSAEAARETGDMIQNSMDKAQLGSQIAGETAKSLKEIVTGINESTDLISEIAVASNEQSSGIAQINIGIDQVAQVVQQNSATVQESAAASEEMSSQSDILRNLIAQFRLRDDDSGRRGLPSSGNKSRKLTSTHDSDNYAHTDNFGGFGKY